jgi:predicted enzyme related to lactoylglutathione lyase
MICQTTDMDRSVAFYRDVLGLTPGVVSPYWSDFVCGDVRVGIHPIMQGAEPPLGVHLKGWSLGVQIDDLRALRTTLEEHGARIHGGYHDVPGGVALDFEDPEHNPIQAIQLGVSAADLS